MGTLSPAPAAVTKKRLVNDRVLSALEAIEPVHHKRVPQGITAEDRT